MAYREEAAKIHLVAQNAVYALVAPRRPLRVFLLLQCDLATGVSMYVTWGDINVGSKQAFFELQPGDICVFSRYGDMFTTLPVWISGNGGNAVCRGGEEYLEKT